MFHCKIQNNHQALRSEEEKYRPIPTIRDINHQTVQDNYDRIKQEVKDLVETEYSRIESSEDLATLLVPRNE